MGKKKSIDWNMNPDWFNALREEIGDDNIRIMRQMHRESHSGSKRRKYSKLRYLKWKSSKSD